MATPNAHPDSFESTSPFDFSAATYFIPMTALLGVGIASVIIGTISDKVGRRPCVLVCLCVSTVLSIVKYLCRRNFWAFCGVNFINGLFSATTPLAMAYMGDVFTDKDEKTMAIGMVGAYNMVGMSGGGICAILLESQGLFIPLLLGAGLMAVSSILNIIFLVEPNRTLAPSLAHQYAQVDDKRMEAVESNQTGDQAAAWVENETDEKAPPETLDNCLLWNIIFGAFADNVGTSGLNPMCLSPLAFIQYYRNFWVLGLTPVMSLNAYKWISTLIAIMIIPSAVVSPQVFKKMGAAGACVSGNIVTAAVTVVLLYVATAAPATSGWFGAFVAILYTGFPVTVFSQLSTGPMLDTISPASKRGYTQGLNTSALNFGQALTPWLLGLLADATSTSVAIWTCVGVSLFAAVVNVPLLFRDGLGPPKKVKQMPDEGHRGLVGEDDELVEKVLRGEYVPVSMVDQLNEERIKLGKQLLVQRYGQYSDNTTGDLEKLRQNAKSDFKHLLRRKELFVGDLNKGEARAAVCERINAAMNRLDENDITEANQELGVWFTDYLKDNGYRDVHMSATATKQMIMSAFPSITQEKEFTPENVEATLLDSQRVYRKFVCLEDQEELYTKSIRQLIASKGSAPIVY
uniref:Major facilitator superfamily (MFS) profile domain-containing protein n=1 Tax=Attheya septentrionalis TaxID=420275 RepID=A0A6T7JU88_9STRA